MARKLGPYTRKDLGPRKRSGGLDGRTREAALLRGFRAELTEFVGGSPDLIQSALIDRVCAMHLRLAILDSKLTGDMTQHDNNFYIAWTNAYRRCLLALMGKPETSEMTSEEALAAIHKAAAPAEPPTPEGALQDYLKTLQLAGGADDDE